MESLYLNVLKDAASAIASSRNQQEALGYAVGIVARRLAFDVCSVYLYDTSRKRLWLAASHGLRAQAIGQVEMALGEGLTGEVARSRRPLFTSDAARHPGFKFFPETGEEQLETFGGVPLLRRGSLAGVLTVQTKRRHEFHANEIVMLETVARFMVSVIDVSQVVKNDTRRIARPSVDTLSGLGTSPGIALARATVVGDARNLPLPALPFAGEAEELARFERARAAAIAEADAVNRSLETDGVAPAALEIISAHKAMLADPHLAASVAQLIAAEKISAAHALDKALAPLIEKLERMPAMREKSHDLADIRTQLLAHLGVAVAPEQPGSGEPVVVMAESLSPAQTARLDATSVAAIVTEHGSAMSHMSILARSRGIPAVVGVEHLLETVRRGDRLLVDGDNGFVFVEPDERTIEKYFKRKQRRATTHTKIAAELERLELERPQDAPRTCEIQVNLGFASEVSGALAGGAMGVGLLRTEFFFLHQKSWPTPEEQLAYYEPILEAFAGREVTIRLLDIGGDQQLPYLPHMDEPNPILGYRSIRLLLDHPDVYHAQLKAIFAAARRHPTTAVRVMVPMVTTHWEMQSAREVFDELKAEHAPELVIPFGMMIEVPAVLFQLEHYFPVCDFFSVGTNDLVQYLLAVDRENERVRNRYQPHHPAVLRALDMVARTIGDRPLAVCGEMAGQPDTALALLALGFRHLSVSIPSLPHARYLAAVLAGVDLSSLRTDLLALPTAERVSWALRETLRAHAPLLGRVL